MAKRESGKYVNQLEGYKAFLPHPLPPFPPLEFDNEIRTLLSKADRALGRLDGSIQSLPDPELFVFMYVRKEAVLSSQIEGTQASLGDLLQAEAELFDPLRPNDTDEIINYVASLNHGLNRLKEIPLSLRLFREIHAKLMSGVRGDNASPGEFRTTQNWIGSQGATLKSASFIPPPPSDLMSVLGALESYIHVESELPLLVEVGLIHAQFETIHPFLDGNGRMGRLLITFLLCEREALIKPVLYLSHYLKANRLEYYDRLQAVRTKGDWEGWLKFFLIGVVEVANESTDTARKIVSLREEHRNKLIDASGKGAANALKLLEILYQKPIITVNVIRDELGVSVQAANKIAERFQSLGLLFEFTGNQRYRVFRYDPYVEIFID